MHFAGLLSVGESVARARCRTTRERGEGPGPARRDGARPACTASSSAPPAPPTACRVRVPMDEDHPQEPINPYGATKRAFERALADHARGGTAAGGGAALLQRRGLPSRRHPGRGPRARGAPHPAGHRRRPRAGGRRFHPRRRLRHARRHLHPRLHPRAGPGPRPRRRPCGPGRRRRRSGPTTSAPDRPFGARGRSTPSSGSPGAQVPAAIGPAAAGRPAACWWPPRSAPRASSGFAPACTGARRHRGDRVRGGGATTRRATGRAREPRPAHPARRIRCSPW